MPIIGPFLFIVKQIDSAVCTVNANLYIHVYNKVFHVFTMRDEELVQKWCVFYQVLLGIGAMKLRTKIHQRGLDTYIGSIQN